MFNCTAVMFLSLLVLFHTFTISYGQASGDEDASCVTLPNRNEIVLMDSSNYLNLLRDDGGPWIVVDEDDNNEELMGRSIPTVRCYIYS